MGIVLKVLLVVGVILGVVWALRGRGRSLKEPQAPRRTEGTPSQDPPATPQDMVTCARCGVHVPASEAVDSGARRYCSAEHRDADRAG